MFENISCDVNTRHGWDCRCESLRSCRCLIPVSDDPIVFSPNSSSNPLVTGMLSSAKDILDLGLLVCDS